MNLEPEVQDDFLITEYYCKLLDPNTYWEEVLTPRSLECTESIDESTASDYSSSSSSSMSSSAPSSPLTLSPTKCNTSYKVENCKAYRMECVCPCHCSMCGRYLAFQDVCYLPAHGAGTGPYTCKSDMIFYNHPCCSIICATRTAAMKWALLGTLAGMAGRKLKY